MAVIDTGADLEHHALKRYMKDGHIAGWRDFVSDERPGEMTDTVGHGTHITHVLLHIGTPYIQVYIARAFETRASEQDTEERVVKARKQTVAASIEGKD